MLLRTNERSQITMRMRCFKPRSVYLSAHSRVSIFCHLHIYRCTLTGRSAVFSPPSVFPSLGVKQGQLSTSKQACRCFYHWCNSWIDDRTSDVPVEAGCFVANWARFFKFKCESIISKMAAKQRILYLPLLFDKISVMVFKPDVQQSINFRFRCYLSFFCQLSRLSKAYV